jgi:hypothetical protein
MEKLADTVMDVIKKGNQYFQSEVGDGMWKFVLERQAESTVQGEVTVEHSEPYGVMLPDVVEHLSADPVLSKYFSYDYPTRRMALRAEHCRKLTDFSRAMNEILSAVRNLPGNPFGGIGRDLDMSSFKWNNGVSQKRYRLPSGLAFIFGIVTERFAANLYSVSEDGQFSILVQKTKEVERCSRSQPMVDYMYADELERCYGQTTDDVDYKSDVDDDEDDGLDKLGLGIPNAGTASFGHIGGRTADPVAAGRPYFGLVHVFDIKRERGPVCKEEQKPWKEFVWITPKEARIALLSGEFTPVAGLFMLDFLYRHDLLDISMSDEQKKSMADALHPLKNIPHGFAGAVPDVTMIRKESNSQMSYILTMNTLASIPDM